MNDLANSESPTCIHLEQVSKVFRGSTETVTALTPTDLTVTQGEFVVVVGPSGCGKTTLLRMIGGLTQPSAGLVEVFGKPLWTASGGKSKTVVNELGFVFQQANLLPWRTVEKNIALPLENRNVPKSRRLARARELCELVGIQGFEKAYPHELSGGMAQRVAIARGLSHNPKILLMDEPFGALDAITRDQMNLELQRIWMETGATVVLVTHSIAESVFLGDRIVSFTARPGRMAGETTVSFVRPRSLELTEDIAFQSQVGSIRELLAKPHALEENEHDTQ